MIRQKIQWKSSFPVSYKRVYRQPVSRSDWRDSGVTFLY